MSATESPSSPGPDTRDVPHIHEHTETPAAPTDRLAQTQDGLVRPDSSQIVQMSAQDTTEAHPAATPSDPAAMDLTTAQPPQAEAEQLAGQLEGLSVSGDATPNLSSSANTPPPK